MTEARTFGIFLDLESEARQADTLPALRFVMVNAVQRLVTVRQAVLVSVDRDRRPRVEAVSNVPEFDRHAPFPTWLERAVAEAGRRHDLAAPTFLGPGDLSPETTAQWAEWSPPQALWLPLKVGDGALAGGLWLARETAWSTAERHLLERLAECYAHAWEGLAARAGLPLVRRRGFPRWAKRLAVAAALAAAAAGLVVPVPQTVVAPAEVVPARPLVVAAPQDGVIRQVMVRPFQPVRSGDALFAFDDTSLRANREVARRSLSVAAAELEKARQSAFFDAESRAKVDLEAARVQLREAEVAYAETLLSQVVVLADADGVAIFSDEQEWLGRPVKTGEKVMELAAPDAVALRIDLPVGDAIDLPPEAPVSVFLGVDPLTPLPARLVRTGYRAQPTADGILAFRLDARFEDGRAPRIGLRGTARVDGWPVPLFVALFRRPVAAARQFLGV